MGLEIFSSPAWEVEGVTGIEDLYAEAVGLRKK
jgi:hypothetical protein